MRTHYLYVLMWLFVCASSGCVQKYDFGDSDGYTPESTTVQGVMETADTVYSPFVNEDFPNQVYFGDTHLHTSYSVDAGMIGNILSPADAYRFARGEAVTSSTGIQAKLVRPLDFLVVSDHAEALGVAPMIRRSDPLILKDPLGKQLHALVQEGTQESLGEAFNLFTKTKNEGTNTLASNPDFPIIPWEEIIDAAEAANDPGDFTAFIGFEWTSAPRGANLHRVVIYRDDKAVANTRIPLSSDLNPDPEALWDWMEKLERETGGRVLAIPHNGNVSNGLMFDSKRYGSEDKLDKAYAERRQYFEPLYEVTQMKGDGEAHPILSPDDEFADFETWDQGFNSLDLHTEDMIPREYAREALKNGLAHLSELGVNPFKFGMVGSTDAHTSLPTTRENNFFGKVAQLEPSADPFRQEEVIGGRFIEEAVKTLAWQTSASGLAAVWAKENTREALFEAMLRKEVYATTGTRLKVRLFAGFNFTKDDLYNPSFAKNGYAKGVPMGGDLMGSSEAPRFLIRAMRDSDGANLDRIQVVKGWLDESGTTHEKVYDVAVSGDRVIDPNGRCTEPVGNTVNAELASYDNSIGAPILESFWIDPDFNPNIPSFYYVRVLEIPTPRWTSYDARVFNKAIPEGAPVSIQDRAYTSPVWYTPTN